MNHRTRQPLIGVAAFIASMSATIAYSSLFPRFAGPPVVRFIGAFQEFNEKAAGNLNTLTVTIGNQKWLFQVSRVDTITGSDPGMMILNNIFPPELHFFGPPDRLAPLEKPDIVGKQVSLEGFLYISDRTFYVATANIAS